MSNANFIVQNGISVGGPSGATISADPTTGAVVISAAPTASQPNPVALVFNNAGAIGTVATSGGVANVAAVSTAANTASGTTGGNVSGNLSLYSITGLVGAGNLNITGNIIPTANITYDLGSKTNQWHSAYIGPGTLYINGTPVLSASTTGTPTINFSASSGQNMSIQTIGGGILQLSGNTDGGGGYVAVQSTLQVKAGAQITSSDGNPVLFSNGIGVNSLSSQANNTDLTITAQGTGQVKINKDTVVTGNFTVTGTTETINTSVLNVYDQYMTMNAGTTGTPTLDAGLRVNRGTSNNAVLKWSESAGAWQYSSDNVTFSNIGSGGGGNYGNTQVASYLPGYTGNIGAANVTATSVTTNTVFINNTTITTNVVVGTGQNAFSVGPMTVASGYSVTVATGQRWVVI